MKNYLIGAVILALVAILIVVLIQPLPKKSVESKNSHNSQLHMEKPSDVHLPPLDINEDLNSYWLNHGKSFLRAKLAREPNTKRAKNAIVFMGNGMGLSTIAATRSYIGGIEKQLSFEKFPYTGLSKTYSVDRIVTDSATAATAYLCGIKSTTGTIGMNAETRRGDCLDTKNSTKYVESIGKWALDAGKSIGFITTTTVTHASPGGLYAHTTERNWESEKSVEESCGKDSGVESIAAQLIHGEVGKRLKVMMGGGKVNFVRDEKTNLIDDYKAQSQKNGFVETRSELISLDLNSVDRLLGVFSDGHMDYNLERIDEGLNQPSLEEMTRKAIEFMNNDENGYFLFIEGGRIDTAHHNNEAKLSLDETEQFSKAIQAAREITREDDTLIIVSADHSHTLSFAGYMDRSQIITEEVKNADDGIPYMALSYATGPGFKSYYNKITKQRIGPSSTNKNNIHAKWPATVPQSSGGHGGEDVAVYASGPWAHLFTGVYEQNTIPHMLAYALCIGNGLKYCDE
ncbi:alkaline phosphatase, tissue-nonspecific isozyme-like [Episyrphus balteatus]|uniref:alkaline phosphatase, tissue-nonspecific isozyme-like n=1 Tax=Episyrphus balteatus TaxID=286459 RepID=UPI0024852E9E|nr:alkaline phosphatase, tissue-nonspecific isozyme-like [Episyrphus balteatus]